MGVICMLQLLGSLIHHVTLTLLMVHMITAKSGKPLCLKATFILPELHLIPQWEPKQPRMTVHVYTSNRATQKQHACPMSH